MNRNQNPPPGEPDFSGRLKKTLKRYQSMPRLYRVMKYGVLFMLCNPALIALAGFLKLLGVPLPSMATIHVLMECALMLDGMLLTACVLLSTIILSLPRTEEHDERYFAQSGERWEGKSASTQTQLPDYWRLYLPENFGTWQLLFFEALSVLPAFAFVLSIPQSDVSPLRDFWEPFRILLIVALALLVSVNLSRGLFLLVSRLRCYRTKKYKTKTR